MTDSPAKLTDLPDQSTDPIPEMLEAAWESVQEMLAEDGQRWNQSLASPISKSSPAAATATQRQVVRETVGLLVHAAMEFQVRLAYVQKQRVLAPQQLAAIFSAVAGFAKALAENAEVRCTAADCDWKGSPAEAGPIGKCPTCGKPARMLPLPSKILGPTGQVLEA